MFYEVFIPSAGSDGFDVTITVEAENWMAALKSGLSRTGEGEEAIRNVMCDIKQDNSIHVTDAGTRRVFVLKEVQEGASDEPEAPAEEPAAAAAEDTETASPEMKTIRMSAPDFDNVKPQSKPEPAPEIPRTPTKPLVPQIPKPDGAPPVAAAPEPAVVVTPEPAVLVTPEPAVVVTPEPSVVVAPEPQTPAPSVVVAQEPAPAPAPSIQVDPSALMEPIPQPEPASTPNKGFGTEPAPLPTHTAKTDFKTDSSDGWTSEDASRLRIGSSTFKALQSEEPATKVVREERHPSGQRQALSIGRSEEKVSDNALEEVFLEITRIHEGEMTMEQVVNYVMDMAMDKVRAEAGSIMFADVNGAELYFATARGPKAHEVMNFRVPMSKGIVGFCTREGVSLAISDAEHDPRFYKEVSEALGYPTKSLCCAPIQFEGRVYGAIELLNKDTQKFTSAEINVLTYIGRQLGRFVQDLIMAQEKLD